MADPLDLEILDLINRLSKIQSEIGGGKIHIEAKGEDGKIDRFLDLKVKMVEKLNEVKERIDTAKSLEKVPGSNPRELIGLQSQIRGDMKILADDLNELDNLYRAETKKKRSKFKPAELVNRQNVVIAFQEEIEILKDSQRAGYVKGYEGTKLKKLEDSDLFKPNSNDYNAQVSYEKNRSLTEGQRSALLQIKKRDALIDEEIIEIGKGVDDLQDIANAANEEVKIQTSMLEVLESKVDDAHDKVLHVNERLKSALDETRKSDKICLDIFCLLILVGMIIVVVKLSQSAKS